MRLALRSVLVLIGVLLVAGLAPAGSTAATTDEEDAIVVISGPAQVGRGEAADGVFVVHGDATVAGTVTGDVFVLDGDATVSGHIEGDLLTAAGQARLLAGASVDGDVLYGDEKPLISPTATVSGEVSDENWNDAFGALPVVGAIVIWAAFTISALILGIVLVMVAPRAADAVFAQAERRMLLCVVFGIATFVAIPFAAVLAAATLLGLPLGLALLLALLPLAAVAYVTTAWVLGRAIVRRPDRRVLAFLAGLAILRLLALIPVLGILVWFCAVIVGLGLLVGALGASRTAPAGRAPGPTAPAGA